MLRFFLLWVGRQMFVSSPPTMLKITYITHDGARHVIDVPPGQTVMDGALSHNLKGIWAYCVGDCGCATCHVYVDEAWLAKTGEMSDKERDTLEYAVEVAPNSRLSCQIEITDALDGLIVRMPERQY
jgi:2Fe-2S ferredoxin